MKTRNIIAWILILIFTDQTIKILINVYFGNVHFEIIPSLLEFKPTFNERHSWVNNLLDDNFGINAGLIPHRSEEHTSELQSRPHRVCRLLLEKKNKK